MKRWQVLVWGIFGLAVMPMMAQRNASGGGDVGTSQIRIGEEGIVWYATWEVALEEAQRSQRPILFMSAACQKGLIPGVF